MTDYLIPLTVLLFILQALDYHTTTTILNRGGKELNPIMVKLFDKFGRNPTLVVKAFVVTGLGYYAGSENIWLIAVIVAAYVGVIAFNYRSM